MLSIKLINVHINPSPLTISLLSFSSPLSGRHLRTYLPFPLIYLYQQLELTVHVYACKSTYLIILYPPFHLYSEIFCLQLQLTLKHFLKNSIYFASLFDLPHCLPFKVKSKQSCPTAC